MDTVIDSLWTTVSGVLAPHGIIGPALFAMLVLMAIVTTMMAGPLFELVYGRRARERGELATMGR